jgi:CRISPR-associated protein Csb2
MLTISVELLHGTIRSTGSEDTSITGDAGRGEWPPSPARLFSALVAADGTGQRQHMTDGRELLLLERAAPPRILASPIDAVLRSDLRDRFVVMDKTHVDNKTRETGAVQEYAGRTNTQVRPGTRLAPASARVTFVWDDLDLDEGTMQALACRAARVGYLGCADSPAAVAVGREKVDGDEWWVPSDDGAVVLPVPYEGFLSALDDSFEHFQAGEPTRRAWVPNRYVRYRPPGHVPDQGAEPVPLWVLFEPSVSGRRLLAVTESFRQAVLEHYTLAVAGDADHVPSVLSGHGFDGTGYHHAHFLALPDVGHRHARGSLHGAAVMLPPGTPAEVVEGVRESLWRISTLARPGVFETRVRPHGGEARQVSASPSRWQGPSRHWVSATPVVHERFQRGGPDLEEVARWCSHAGVMGQLVRFRTATVPILEGALALAPTEVYRAGKDKRPYSHLEVVFDRPVPGPLVLGGARQFGFGLMYPVPSTGRDSG